PEQKTSSPAAPPPSFGVRVIEPLNISSQHGVHTNRKLSNKHLKSNTKFKSTLIQNKKHTAKQAKAKNDKQGNHFDGNPGTMGRPPLPFSRQTGMPSKVPGAAVSHGFRSMTSADKRGTCFATATAATVILKPEGGDTPHPPRHF